jgi:peptidoglycan hydrolase CwlO-like protein
MAQNDNSKVTIAHLLTTLALLLSGVTFINDLTTEVAKQRVEVDNIAHRMDREIDIATSGRGQLSHAIEKLDGKLDKILDTLTRDRN